MVSSYGAFCVYDNDTSNAEIYGYLYNWFTVKDDRSIAPEGWHVPTDDEWKELEMYLGMSQSDADMSGYVWRGTDEGDKLKQSGHEFWWLDRNRGTNESGFTALPGGYRDVNGLFYVGGYSSYWWSSAEKDAYFSWYRSLYHSSTKIHRTTGYKGDGFSVRCLRDS